MRVLVVLDLKAAFQNVSRRAMQHSIVRTDSDFAGVFSRWCTGITEHRMHYDSVCTKIIANCGGGSGLSSITMWILSNCRPNTSPNHGGALLSSDLKRPTLRLPPETIAVVTASTTSVNLAPHVCQNTSLERRLPRPNSTEVPRQGHVHTQLFGRTPYKSMEILSPALLFWVSRLPWENTTL